MFLGTVGTAVWVPPARPPEQRSTPMIPFASSSLVYVDATSRGLSQTPHDLTGLPYDHTMTEDLAICLQADLQTFCKILETAYKPPAESAAVQSVFHWEAMVTVFAPTDRGIKNRQSLIENSMGVTMDQIMNDPVVAARFVEMHVVMGQNLLFSNFRDGQTYSTTNNVPAILKIVEGAPSIWAGAHKQFFIDGPVNKVRVGYKNRWNIHGARGAVHIIEDPIIAGPDNGYSMA
eukprot:gene37-12846_t